MGLQIIIVEKQDVLEWRSPSRISDKHHGTWNKMILSLFFMAICGATTSIVGHNLTDSEILQFEAPAILLQNLPYYLSGYDDEGSPIWIFELGKWDLRRFAEESEKMFEAMDIYGDQMFLNFRESGLNSTAEQFTTICDMDGFNIRQAGNPKTVQFILSKFARFEQIAANGTYKGGWFVNANYLWERIWQLGKHLLGSLSELIEIYGTNKEVWIPKILRKLPKDQIPEWYGGIKEHKPVLWLG